MKKKFRSFKEAREFAQSLSLKGQKEWFTLSTSKKLPKDIPYNPASTYLRKGWKSWGDFLGTGNISSIAKSQSWKPFKDTRKYARSLGLSGNNEWRKIIKSGNLLSDIPTKPDEVYRNKGWKSWGDWLGTGIVATYKLEFRNFKEARKFTHSIGLKNNKEWRRFSKSNKKPQDIPADPENVYKKEWTSWGDFLGTGTIAMSNIEFRTFLEAREFVQSLKLKTNIEWREFVKSKDSPSDIPTSPDKVYKKEWTSWGDWLGTGRIAFEKTQWLPFQEAKKEYQKLSQKFNIKGHADWRKFIKTHELPNDLPYSPWVIYSKENVLKRMKKN